MSQADTYKYFRVEARELLTELDAGVLDLERGATASEVVPRLLRLAHTLKGAARVVRQGEIADHAHAVEEALGDHRESAAPIPGPRLAEVADLLDRMNSRVAALDAPDGRDLGPTPQPAPEPPRTVRADLLELDELLETLTEAHAHVAALRGEVDDVDGQLGLVTSGRQRLGGRVERLDRELRLVRDAVERLRLLPARSLFTDLAKAARDVARLQAKRVTFEGRGGELRVDADVLAAVRSALHQIVRNAVAHGIEAPEERVAAGKPPGGTVTLDVVRSSGGRVAFTCHDDGRGVDLDAVRTAIARKGGRSLADDELTAEDLVEVLVRGGITTSDIVTEVAGRGIGLDVVRDAAARVGGEVRVVTEPGSGTTVVFEAPVSRASFPALAVELDGATATIPLSAVRQTARVARDDVAHGSEGESIVVDGEVVPFLPLPIALAAGTAPPQQPRAWSVVVVACDAGVAAVGVHRLLGTTSVVARPLPEPVVAAPVVAGLSLDAAGKPQLILDPDGLVTEAGRWRRRDVRVPQRPSVLVVDDSLTTRMLEQSILLSAGFDVDVAASGEEALAKATTTSYDLLLVDVEMPGMDGFMLIERVRADPGLREVPCILVTSRTSNEDRRRGLEVGAQAYITKGEFDQGQLLERIRQLTRR